MDNLNEIAMWIWIFTGGFVTCIGTGLATYKVAMWFENRRIAKLNSIDSLKNDFLNKLERIDVKYESRFKEFRTELFDVYESLKAEEKPPIVPTSDGRLQPKRKPGRPKGTKNK